MSKKSKVQVNYKSGISVVFECDDFKIKYNSSGVTSYEGDNMKPKSLFIGFDDIESIWEL